MKIRTSFVSNSSSSSFVCAFASEEDYKKFCEMFLKLIQVLLEYEENWKQYMLDYKMELKAPHKISKEEAKELGCHWITDVDCPILAATDAAYDSSPVWNIMQMLQYSELASLGMEEVRV